MSILIQIFKQIICNLVYSILKKAWMESLIFFLANINCEGIIGIEIQSRTECNRNTGQKLP